MTSPEDRAQWERDEEQRSNFDTLRLRTAALHRVAHENDRLRAALSRVRALTYASDDGGEYAHNPGCGGEYNCPACWADDIRQAIA